MRERNRPYLTQSAPVISEDGETQLCSIPKHPAGIIALYVVTGIGFLAGVALILFITPSVLEDTSKVLAVSAIFAVATGLIAIAILLLATMVYYRNRLIVTDRNVTQILQTSLFSKKVSQLNLVNVEDVTSEQNGFFATIFGYGVLKIETAGEQMNFNYTYCPRPNHYAGIILNARERVLGQVGKKEKPTKIDLPPGVIR